MRITWWLIFIAAFAFFAGYAAQNALSMLASNETNAVGFALGYALGAALNIVAVGLGIRRVARQVDQPIK